MRKTTTSTTRTTTSTPAATANTGLTRGQVEELVDDLMRTAFRDHSRNMEQHLKNIHERLLAIETHGALR
ncbi:MAG TPA: hypothetical protein EYN67_06340 [Flavobacteriales bacterium]|nr:hypothetical protein [Flavobacteriales bacterium]